MYLILDACTVINLLQVDLLCEDEDCRFEYDYLSKIINTNFKIEITEKVFQEIQTNYSANLQYRYQINTLDKHINTMVKQFTYLSLDQEIFDDILTFIKRRTNYTKDNGELHSTAYALYLSRYKYTYTDSLILQTNFVTDDDGAYDDFISFFQSNQLGSIFSTLDLLMLLHIKDVFTFSHIIRFALDLKKQYISSFNILLNEIEDLQKKSLPTKTISYLSTLHKHINDLDFEKIEETKAHSEYTKVSKSNKKIDSLLTSLLSSNLKKVQIIDKKIKELKNLYWSL